MKNKRTYLMAIFISFLPVIAGLLLYPKFPNRIATHWGFNGEANGYSSKIVGVIVLPLLLAVLSIFMPKLLEMDPKNKDMNDKLRNSIIWLLPIINVMCSSFTMLEALGIKTKIEVIAPLIIAITFIIIGNYLPKAKQNYTVGIKVPWTLDDEENWDKTHRLGGFLFVFGGIVLAISSFFKLKAVMLFVVIFLVGIVPIVYSYILHKKKK